MSEDRWHFDSMCAVLQSRCQMYVRKSVWDAHATPIGEMVPKEATAPVTATSPQDNAPKNPLTSIK